MQKILINYCNNDFKEARARLTKSALEKGNFDRVIEYSAKDIDKDFYQANKKILNKRRGAGYWLWKPYIIHKTLKESSIKDGDIVFYCDAGIEFLAPIDSHFSLFNELQQDVILFDTNVLCKDRCKRDSFILMNCDEQKAYDFPVILAGVQFYKKSLESITFIEKLLKYCSDYRIITDSRSKLGQELEEFRWHRHDQSIFSLMAYKSKLSISHSESLLCGLEFGDDKNKPLLLHRNHNRTPVQAFLYQVSRYPEDAWAVGKWRAIKGIIVSLVKLNIITYKFYCRISRIF